MNKAEKIMEFLPEGVDDAIATEIANLVSNIVNEQVEARVKILEAKVHGFLRSNIEKIKEHAIAELVQENDQARDAAMFREIKSLFVEDLNEEDQLESVKRTSQENDDLVGEVAALTEELTEATREKEKLRVANKALSGKVNMLSESLKEIKVEVESIQENRRPVKSSEKALMASVVKEETKQSTPVELGQLASMINEESMKLMPFKNGRH